MQAAEASFADFIPSVSETNYILATDSVRVRIAEAGVARLALTTRHG